MANVNRGAHVSQSQKYSSRDEDQAAWLCARSLGSMRNNRPFVKWRKGAEQSGFAQIDTISSLPSAVVSEIGDCGFVRAAVARHAGEQRFQAFLGDHQAGWELVRCLRSSDPQVRSAAQEYLLEAGPRSIKLLALPKIAAKE